MAKQSISLGTAPTGAGGDDSRSAMVKINSNFDELYAGFGGTIPAGSAAAAPIVGTTSAIFQRGSNANGEWVRFQDGTQICWSNTMSPTVPAQTSSPYTSVTFPIAFFDTGYSVSVTVQPVNSWDHFGCIGIDKQSTSLFLAYVRNGSVAQQFRVVWQAIGRWK